jgi:hypothetical protein
MVNELTGYPARGANMAGLPGLWHREANAEVAFI